MQILLPNISIKNAPVDRLLHRLKIAKIRSYIKFLQMIANGTVNFHDEYIPFDPINIKVRDSFAWNSIHGSSFPERFSNRPS